MDHAERIELAQAAYEAYGVSTGGKNYQGLPMPSWDDLGVPIRTAWVAATTAVVAGLRDGQGG
jgi:hypothetical protein